jgi:PadR family transcriptional regulator, regulatory protein PadR
MAHDEAHEGQGSPDARATPYPKNWLTAVLLLILRDWSTYGYELMEQLTRFGFAAMNPGTVYRVLRQMEKDGMVSSNWDTSGAGPARRVYSVTEAGEAYLKLWAASLEQYQNMMETFFRLYTGRPFRPRSQDDTRR